MKISPQVAVKIKELEIHTRKILSGSLIGSGKTRQKGFGFEFDQLRTYQYGDDVRLIDWKSSARYNNLLVRQYFEDRNRTIILCVDLSASTFFGSDNHLKLDIIQQVAGIIALAGAWSSDKVGLILFTDRIEKVFVPAKGHKHVHQLLEQLFSYKPEGKGTNYQILAEYIATRIPKQAMIVMISDFLDNTIFDEMKKFAATKDVVAIVCNDNQEHNLDYSGYVWMQDPETSQIALVNGQSSQLSTMLSNRVFQQKSEWFSARVDVMYLQGEKDLIHNLITFFQNRMS